MISSLFLVILIFSTDARTGRDVPNVCHQIRSKDGEGQKASFLHARKERNQGNPHGISHHHQARCIQNGRRLQSHDGRKILGQVVEPEQVFPRRCKNTKPQEIHHLSPPSQCDGIPSYRPCFNCCC